MNCDDVRELLPAYALDALTAEEHEAVRAHLEGCALHPELAELLATVEALPAVVDKIAPPPELRARVLALADNPASGSVPIGSDGALPPPIRLEERRSNRSSTLLPWALAAAFGLLALASFVLPRSGPVGQPTLVHREGTAVGGQSRASLTYEPSSQLVVFEVSSLSPAPPGREYQLWVVRGQTPVSLGVFVPSSDGAGSVVTSAPLAPGEVVAVTVEPTGGSPAPTTQPFLAITF